MPLFDYKGLTPDGQTVTDVLEAASRREAMTVLSARGLQLLRLQAADAGSSPGQPSGGALPGGRVSAQDREAFTRQLSSLLGAGVPLATALEKLVRETRRKGARGVWQTVHDRVTDGASLADAMAQFPQVFPRVYIAMVCAGETGGFLELVLSQIADFQARAGELRSRLIAALIYPMVLAVLCVAVVIFLLTFFIPRFESMFSDVGGTLPVLTQAILAASDAVRRWGVLAGVAACAVLLAVRRRLASPAGRRRWEGALLRLPVVGKLTARLAMTRFCRMLGTLIGAGVPLVTSLRVASESLGNQILLDAVRDAVQKVQRGNRLAESLGNCPLLFPGSVVAIVAVAEASACLDRELVRLAETAEKQLDRQLQAAVALAEPAMLFVMAGIIGTIVIGMVLPIFSLQDYIQ